MATYFSFDPATDPQAVMVTGPLDKLPLPSAGTVASNSDFGDLSLGAPAAPGATSMFDFSGPPLIPPLRLPSINLSGINPSWALIGGMGLLATLVLLKPASAPPARRRKRR
jgi:hypothetical protein